MTDDLGSSQDHNAQPAVSLAKIKHELRRYGTYPLMCFLSYGEAIAAIGALAVLCGVRMDLVLEEAKVPIKVRNCINMVFMFSRPDHNKIVEIVELTIKQIDKIIEEDSRNG